MQYFDVVISRRRTLGGEGEQTEQQKNEKKSREKKWEVEERAIDAAHVIACFM